MEHIYRTKGTCSREISFELDGDKVRNVHFVGGCDGNLKGIAKLLPGMKAEDVIARLDGTLCGFRNTSCPDQIAQNLKKALEEMN